jgi:quinolinate synthase
MNISALQREIRKELRERKAILLAHYYQRDEIQDIADFLGDSLALSIEAAKTDAAVIVFAGVHFMAESASILSPDKTVLLPRLEAGCPLADMITPEQLERARAEHPGVPVVTYVNSSAVIKAMSDICCTSANAVKVVNSLESDSVLMVPDGNLARYTARLTKKEVIPWNGYCPVHHFLTADQVKDVMKRHPGAKLAVHPECTAEVIDLADFAGSTAGIIRYAREADAGELIIGTESGILHTLKKENPGKTFILASEKLICETMKTITLEDILASLREMKHVVKVPEAVGAPARKALSRMIKI